MFKCNVCGNTFEKLSSWKIHATRTHGRFTASDLREVVTSASGEEGVAVSGERSFADAAASAPTTDSEAPRRVKKRTSAEERDIRERLNKIRLGVCKAAARIPYSLTAVLMNEPAFALEPDETQNIADVYSEIAEVMGWEFISALWLSVVAIEVNEAAFMKRWPLIKQKLGGGDNEKSG